MAPLGCRGSECPENLDLRAFREYQVTLDSQVCLEREGTLEFPDHQDQMGLLVQKVIKANEGNVDQMASVMSMLSP